MLFHELNPRVGPPEQVVETTLAINSWWFRSQALLGADHLATNMGASDRSSCAAPERIPITDTRPF